MLSSSATLTKLAAPERARPPNKAMKALAKKTAKKDKAMKALKKKEKKSEKAAQKETKMEKKKKKKKDVAKPGKNIEDEEDFPTEKAQPGKGVKYRNVRLYFESKAKGRYRVRPQADKDNTKVFPSQKHGGLDEAWRAAVAWGRVSREGLKRR